MTRRQRRPAPPRDPRRPERAELLALVDRLADARVLVLGDAVLDEFEQGEIARVSREAPVLILDHRRTDLCPGGAANTAANLAALDVRAAIAGRIGDDAQGERLSSLLAALGVDARGLVRERGYATPTKTRERSRLSWGAGSQAQTTRPGWSTPPSLPSRWRDSSRASARS